MFVLLLLKIEFFHLRIIGIIDLQVYCRIYNFVASFFSSKQPSVFREFGIVILHAVCAASEPACVVTALETSAVNHLVAFLEAGDASFHQVAQQHGMLALRENPELMGTSVGMLRKAAAIMLYLSRVPVCRKNFTKHQQRLLQFTMSQLVCYSLRF